MITIMNRVHYDLLFDRVCLWIFITSEVLNSIFLGLKFIIKLPGDLSLLPAWTRKDHFSNSVVTKRIFCIKLHNYNNFLFCELTRRYFPSLKLLEGELPFWEHKFVMLHRNLTAMTILHEKANEKQTGAIEWHILSVKAASFMHFRLFLTMHGKK